MCPPRSSGGSKDRCRISISPLDWSIASTSIADAYGFTTLPHLRDMAITGPIHISGVSDTPSRRAIFTCHPDSVPRQATCAHEIVTRLATAAFRRPVTERDSAALMSLYQKGAAEDGFEAGVRLAIEGILASPRFVFRFEERPASARAGAGYAIGDFDLASRLSFFLWASAPDEPLRTLAAAGRLSDATVLTQQVRRMLADPRADVLASRFASQWLRLQDLDKLNPGRSLLPGLRRTAQGGHAARNRAVLRQPRARGSVGARICSPPTTRS